MKVTIHIGNNKTRDFIDTMDINMWGIGESKHEVPKIVINETFQHKVKPF